MAWWDRPTPTVGMEIAMDAALQAYQISTEYWPKNATYYYKRDQLLHRLYMEINKPVGVSTIISWIESRGNTGALRFEPMVYARIHASMEADKIIQSIRKIHNCTYETAAVIYSTSFGEYQMMGCSLYDPALCNMKITIADYLKNIEIDTTGYYPIVTSGFTNHCMLAQDYSFMVFLPKKGIMISTSDLQTKPDVRQRFAIRYNGSPTYANNIVESLQHFGLSVS
jgi:hypothetical protein